MMQATRTRVFIGGASLPVLIAAGLWIAAIAGGLRAMTRYESTPGDFSPAPASWPRDTALVRATDRPTIILVAHPRCPCTRATLSTLADLLSQTTTPVRVLVLMYTPANVDAAWTDSELCRRARRIPGVELIHDTIGGEANRFGARTSGEVLFFNSAGRLAFAGGITGSRGHIGDNDGANAVAALLDGRSAIVDQTPVYGCEIFSPDAPGLAEGGAMCTP